MKRDSVIYLILLLVIAACTTATVVKLVNESKEEPVIEEPIKVISTAEFKILKHYGSRNPDSINGTVKNIGKGPGDVKIVVKVYHAQKVVHETSLIIKDIAKDEERGFELLLDGFKWVSYTITAEKIN